MTTVTATPAVIAPTEVKRTKSQTLTKDMKAKLDRLRKVRTLKSALDKEAKDLTADILSEVAEDTKTLVWGQSTLATLVDSHNNSVTDYKAFAEAFPEAYALFVKRTDFVQVR